MRDSILKDLLKILLIPLALIYGISIWIRNKLYDKKIYRSIAFEVPVLSVGNLAVGGSGKTPLVEYLILLLAQNYRIATLSRGYMRKTKGFIMADINSTATTIGDEPRQIQKKFPGLTVAVGENRMLAIPELLGLRPDLELIVLDDAFQHRSVKPALNILVTDYNKPFFKDHILPLGRLREPASSYHRADIIIATKCPDDLGLAARQRFIRQVKPMPYQKIYFSKLLYRTPYFIWDHSQFFPLGQQLDVLALTGIANPEPLQTYLEDRCKRVFLRNFGDHHTYDRYDLENIKETFQNLPSERKIILTTEKDAARLEIHREWLQQQQLPIYCLPIHIEFFAADKEAFDQDMHTFMDYFREEAST